MHNSQNYTCPPYCETFVSSKVLSEYPHAIVQLKCSYTPPTLPSQHAVYSERPCTFVQRDDSTRAHGTSIVSACH